jgi:hypothetical protein
VFCGYTAFNSKLADDKLKQKDYQDLATGFGEFFFKHHDITTYCSLFSSSLHSTHLSLTGFGTFFLLIAAGFHCAAAVAGVLGTTGQNEKQAVPGSENRA